MLNRDPPKGRSPLALPISTSASSRGSQLEVFSSVRAFARVTGLNVAHRPRGWKVTRPGDGRDAV